MADCVEGILTGYRKAKGRVDAVNLAVEENRTVDEVADLVVREMKLSNVKRAYTGGPRGVGRGQPGGSPRHNQAKVLWLEAEVHR